ncbi:NADH-quinone oxidoreductase subunit H [Thiolapillus sp.]|uniref:NADH-quinone oxidoreductase subunit H n=1 Tax=Thiolapillus sp. TaxID=2017437 RepID=UPI00263ADA4C|nr:NADH-quinone oxidoreductase subunit H [Thiolapillus sp.]
MLIGVSSYAAETLLPVPGMTGIAEKGGLLVLLYMTMIPSLGMALAASSCANPNASIGVARALTAMLAYEVPYVIVIFGAAYHYGTMSFLEILRIQQEQGMAAWGIAQMPLLAIAGLFAMQGMMGKQPFEIYVAPAEIATGSMVEMGGKYMGSLLIMQSFQYYTTAVIYVTLFLGGGSNWLDFLVKVFAVVAIPRCQPWRAKRRLVDPSSREAALFSRRALRQRENKVGLRTRRPVIGSQVRSSNELAKLLRSAW